LVLTLHSVSGWLLGSNPEVQTATLVKNHLSDALMKFFSYNFQFEPLIDFLERLYGKDPEVGAVLAKAYIESGRNLNGHQQGRLGIHLTVPSRLFHHVDQEIKAVHLLYKTLQIAPTKYTVLHAQVDFLVSKVNRDKLRTTCSDQANTIIGSFRSCAQSSKIRSQLHAVRIPDLVKAGFCVY
jgi:Chs5-Arf1p-binding protein BUD7/BCH1